jgi:hypothetical protein
MLLKVNKIKNNNVPACSRRRFSIIGHGYCIKINYLLYQFLDILFYIDYPPDTGEKSVTSSPSERMRDSISSL